MKTVTDWLKTKIINIFFMRHLVILTWRVNKGQDNIFADRPNWVVRLLGHKRIDADFFDDEDRGTESEAAMYNLVNQAVKEHHKRFDNAV